MIIATVYFYCLGLLLFPIAWQGGLGGAQTPPYVLLQLASDEKGTDEKARTKGRGRKGTDERVRTKRHGRQGKDEKAWTKG